LDANLLRVASFFERNSHSFPSQISASDGRAQAILAVIKPTDRVLEVGCGKGRFLNLVYNVYPDADCTGIDISPSLLDQVPQGIQTIQGAAEALRSPDDSFDVVFAVEAIEHSANAEAAVNEMIRVTRPGGWVLVIDKHKEHWGRLDCPVWERWPDFTGMKKIMREGCDDVEAQQIAYDGHPSSDGLMVVWRGRKRSRLTGSQWSEKLISEANPESVIKRVQYNQLSEWAQAILLATSPGEKVLEVGCGTGEVTLLLVQAGRIAMGLDISIANLKFIKQCAEELGISAQTVLADATQPLPFADNEMDCTWSSGLLEHFGFAERQTMLREQARISRRKVIAMVPNAACLAYRAGKADQEKNGTWPYGIETPILSLRDEFNAAGLTSVSEHSVGVKHALSFLPVGHPLRESLSNWMKSMPPNQLQSCHQGYLLVTIGSKT
jgi:ubiquinone/menaquinone biosynthesis C-methylase UbiE